MPPVSGSDFILDKSVATSSLAAMLGGLLLTAPTAPAPDQVHLPISQDGTLNPGTVYPDQSDPSMTWFLPTYDNQTDTGRYTTTLKWRGPDDPTDGALAYLTVNLEAARPVTADAAALEIPHAAVARLSYELPVGATEALPAGGSSVLKVELGALTGPEAATRSCRYAITSKPDFDAIYRALTDEAAAAQLEISCSATVGHRTWRPVFRPPPPPDRVQINPAHVAPSHGLQFSDVRNTLMTQTAVSFAHDFEPIDHASQTPFAISKQSFFQPHQTVVSVDSQAVLVHIAVQSLQTLDCSFPLASNAYMFDIPGDLTPSTHEILIPTQVTVGEQSAIFYQDSLYPDRYYYRPQGFRLSRSDLAPYLPELLFAFLDVTADPDASSATQQPAVDYQVQMGYKALPWISPLLLQQIREQVASTGAASPHFLPLTPQSSQLVLFLGLDTAVPPGSVAPIARPDAHIDFGNGIVDQITLSPGDFTRIVTSLSAGGIDGDVTALLTGATTTDVPLLLALDATVGEVFSHTVQPGTDAGLWLVTLTNLLESPVAITGLFAQEISPGVLARPAATASDPIAPGDSRTVTYTVTPAASTVVDIEPSYTCDIAADPRQLLPLLMVNQGYADETYPLAMSIDPAYFTTPAADGRELAGVTVDFGAGAAVDLTPTQLTATVALRYPLLPWLLKSADAQAYTYQVTNHWTTGADGSPGPIQSGDGAALLVVPNGS